MKRYIENFIERFVDLQKVATDKIKEVGVIDFTNMVNDGDDDTYGEDNRPQVLVADKFDNYYWDCVDKVEYDAETDTILMTLDELGTEYIHYCAAYSDVSIYMEIAKRYS
jgi:hypothetical protein